MVQVMRRIALKPGEIDALPDNLAQAVKAGAFHKTFDPEDPDQAFLPTDLLDKDGSWVAVSNLTRANEAIPGRAGACPLHQRPVGLRGLPSLADRPTGDGSIPEEDARR